MGEPLKGIRQFFSIPLLYQMDFTIRLKCYLFLISTGFLLVLFLHFFIQIDITPVELLIHALFIMTPATCVCLLYEAIGRLYYNNNPWPYKIKTYQFLLIASVIFTAAQLFFDSLFTHFEYYNAIKNKHTDLGYDFKSLIRTFVLSSAVLFVFVQFVLRVNWLSILNYKQSAISKQYNVALCKESNIENNEQSATNNTSNTNKSCLNLKIKGEQISVPFHHIIYIRVEENYCHIWRQTSNEDCERLTVRNTLSKLNEQLPSRDFIKVHRSFVVNLQYLDSLSKECSRYHLILKGGDSIPISMRHLEGVRRVIEKQQVA